LPVDRGGEWRHPADGDSFGINSQPVALKNELPVDTAEKKRWLQLAQEAGAVALVSGLIWILTLVFLDEPLSKIVALILLLGGMMVGFGSKREFPTPYPTLLKWTVSLVFIALAAWVFAPPRPEAEITWEPYSEAVIRRAAEAGRPVIIDFYADWCPPCRELDSRVFTRKQVVDALESFVKVRADLTDQNSSANAAISERYSVSVLPTVVFIGSDGQERRSLRLMGYEAPSRFLGRLRAVK
jgi:thiol:disulfide interchange protein DsbD